MRRLSITTLILGGLVLGVVAGVLFGDLMASLSVVGVIFVRLTQITVLPYIVVSLIHGVGSLDAGTAKRLATRGVPVLAGFWAISIAVYYTASLAFPTRTAASFYDPNRFPGTDQEPGFDWAAYIPANPFESLATGMVPAIVVFSLCLGIAVISARRKEGFLNGLAFVDELLERVNSAIMLYASPVGVFAIVASTVGTIDFQQMMGLGVYAATLLFSLLVIALCILPLLVMAFTGLSYRQLFSAYKAPALLGFTTGSLFITLPMIARATRDLLHARGASEQKAQEVADTLVPVSYSVPLVGTLGALLFVLFAAWFDGTSLALGQYFSLALSGVLSLFAEPRLALGLLLGQMGLPGESLNLYIAAEPLLKNFIQAISVLSTTLFAVLAGAAVLGMARLRLRLALVSAVVSVLVLGAGTAGLSVALRPLADSGTGGYETLQRMQTPSLVPMHVYATAAEAPDPPPALPGESLLDTIQRRGVLRVGYAPQAFPFSYVNGGGDLVGYEVQRADDLAVMLESRRVDFIPVDRQDFVAELDAGFIDTVMSAVEMTPGLYHEVDFSDIYLTLHIAVIAPDTEADLYRTDEEVQDLSGTRVAVEKGSYYAVLLRRANPDFTVVEVDDTEAFFRGGVADILFASAEEGSAWTLKYPHFEVVVPEFEQPPFYLAYPVKKGEVEWAAFLNNFVTVEKESGAQAEQYDYWITGKTAVAKQARWSVVRDVLHWVD